MLLEKKTASKAEIDEDEMMIDVKSSNGEDQEEDKKQ